jgi:hypothetical protein
MRTHLLVRLVAVALCALPCARPEALAQSPANSRSSVAPEADRGIPDSVMRRAVTEHFPGALAGAMGVRPFVWILADSNDKVLRTAIGRDGLVRDPAGKESLTWGAAARMLPGMPQSARPGDLLDLSFLHADTISVGVAWVRLKAGLQQR